MFPIVIIILSSLSLVSAQSSCRTRESWDILSGSKRATFIKAVQQLKNGSQRLWGSALEIHRDPSRIFFDDFVDIHSNVYDDIHATVSTVLLGYA